MGRKEIVRSIECGVWGAEYGVWSWESGVGSLYKVEGGRLKVECITIKSPVPYALRLLAYY